MKPFAVYKLSRIEAALRRLDAAVSGLETASAASVASGGAAPDAMEMAALRRRCDELQAAAHQASAGIDGTVARLKRLLEG